MALPELTPEQRTAALEKAAIARRARAEVKNRLKHSGASLVRGDPRGADQRRHRQDARSRPCSSRCPVSARSGPARSWSGCRSPRRRRVRGLGANQVAALEREFGAGELTGPTAPADGALGSLRRRQEHRRGAPARPASRGLAVRVRHHPRAATRRGRRRALPLRERRGVRRDGRARRAAGVGRVRRATPTARRARPSRSTSTAGVPCSGDRAQGARQVTASHAAMRCSCSSSPPRGRSWCAGGRPSAPPRPADASSAASRWPRSSWPPSREFDVTIVNDDVEAVCERW